jgi:hypothetical protein
MEATYLKKATENLSTLRLYSWSALHKKTKQNIATSY